MRIIYALLAATCLLMHSTFAQDLHYEITGVDGKLLENVKARLHIKRNSHDHALTTIQIQRLYDEAPQEIQQALQPYGYFHAKVNAALSYQKAQNVYQARFHIIPGARLRITHLDIRVLGQGSHDKILKAYLKTPPLQVGQVFETKTYNHAKHLLISTAIKQGYLAAVMQENQVRIDRAHKTVSITLSLQTGRRYFFGDVAFSNTSLRKDFLHRFLTFKKGEAYSQEPLTQLQQSLIDSHFFESVEIIPHTQEALAQKQASVPIEVNLALNKARQYLFGLGYGTDTGARGMLGITLRHITSTGQHFKALLKAAETNTSFSAHYVIPGHHPARDQYTINAMVDTAYERFVGRSHSAKLSADYVTTLGRWKQTLALNLLYDRSKAVGMNSNAVTNILLYPAATWLYVHSDNPLRTNQGLRVNLNIQAASQTVLSSIHFVQATAAFKKIMTFKENTRFIMRGKIGYTETNRLEKLPLSLQFYVGGSHSIRGYRYKSIGPGKQLISASVELQHRLYKHFYASAFYDVGNTRNTNITGSLKQGVGVGLVLLSPLGAIELTIAKAMNQPHKPLLIQFTMGPEL